jgi:TldD protein
MNVRDLLTEALKGHRADYVEVRVEDGESTGITFRGKELEDIGRTAFVGGNARALVNGAWGFVSFNDLHSLRDKVAMAVRQARIAGGGKSALAEVPPVIEVVPLSIAKDPAQVPLSEKVRLLEDYNQIIWSVSPKIQTSVIRYSDMKKTVYFANSQGSYIEQGKMDITAHLSALAREGSDVQQGLLSKGSGRDFSIVEGLHSEVEKTAKRAVELLSAQPVKGGEYTVILDPKLAGVFAHEAFGHLSEADHVYENEKLKEIMILGKRFGRDHLNIVDGAAVPGLRGSFKYDDEGTPAHKTYLIKDGILVGRLHSRETAGKMGETTTGNARAINYLHRPIVRMTNTYIEPGSVSFDDMTADIKLGVYAVDYYGGQTGMEMFTFTAGQGYMIRQGKIAEPVRNVTLTGNVFTTLMNIDAIGNDLVMVEGGGGCGKGDQMPLPVSDGSPHIRITRCVVGGM